MKTEIKSLSGRATTIRLRTWTITLALVLSIVLYFLVKIVTNDNVDLFGFIVTCILQIVMHCLYFPDGELYGQKDEAYRSNRSAYNEKATKINQERRIAKLREYCKFEYEERKAQYVLNECGMIGITLEELNALKQMSASEIKHLEKFEFSGKLIFFTRRKRKRLYNLIFKPLPVEENFPETIMSAVENDGNKAIKDGSISYKTRSYIRKIFIAVIIGLIFAYIGYSMRDGIGFAQIVSIITYLTAMFTSSVLAFSSGETCSKTYKCRFYVALSNFIDGFFEWSEKSGD